MSASSGIQVSEGLTKLFEDALKGSTTAIKVVISNESLVAAESKSGVADVKDDFNSLASWLDASSPCYLVVRLDRNSASPQWVLVAYVPETSQVREKMLYASSRNTLRRQLGNAYFVREYFITSSAELEYSQYLEACKVDEEAKPLTRSEIVLKEQALLERDTSVRSAALGAVPVQIDGALTEAIRSFASGQCNCVLARIDLPTETILCVSASSVDLSSVAALANGNDPLYILFKFQESGFSANVLATYCSDMAPPRQKMLIASCKQTFVGHCESLGLTIENKMDARSSSDLTEQSIREEVRPPSMATAATVPSAAAKPSRPGRGKATVGSGQFTF